MSRRNGMIRITALSGLLAASLGLWFLSQKGEALAQKKDDEPALRAFMRQKLDATNKILEGLCTDDLSMVVEGSDVLLKMSKEEHWRASNDMLYRRYSTEFTDAVSDLREKAVEQSVDGASLAWINATMKCLKCHEWVRNTIIADGGKPGAIRETDREVLAGLIRKTEAAQQSAK
jgi:hypothetical protein